MNLRRLILKSITKSSTSASTLDSIVVVGLGVGVGAGVGLKLALVRLGATSGLGLRLTYARAYSKGAWHKPPLYSYAGLRLTVRVKVGARVSKDNALAAPELVVFVVCVQHHVPVVIEPPAAVDSGCRGRSGSGSGLGIWLGLWVGLG